MDRSCNELMASLSSPKPRFVRNPFDTQFLCKFSGPEPGKLFVDRGGEGHYMFTLHVDFFNPEGMSLRGSHTSSGIISMACLNLPLEIHYKPENMYLAGIIPGPKQPSLENLNHCIRPLIQDLASSWSQGVRYLRTANFPNSHTMHSAVALVVCDLPAARHLAVLAGVGSHFIYSACNCYHKTNYGRVNFLNWVPQYKNKMCEYAEQWRDAPTSAEQEKIFKEHGIHWSELWHLPYWDPARQLVVDSMHCILEGLVQHHVRNLLGITTECKGLPSSQSSESRPAFEYPFIHIDPDTAASLSMSTRECTQVLAIYDLLVTKIPLPDDTDVNTQVDISMKKLADSLLRKNLSALRFVCEMLMCIPPKKTHIYKHDYVKALAQWVRRSYCLILFVAAKMSTAP